MALSALRCRQRHAWLTIQDTDVGADREEERVLAVGSKAPQDEARVLLHLHIVRALRRGRGLLHRKAVRPCAPARAISSVVTAERSWVRAEDSALCTPSGQELGRPLRRGLGNDCGLAKSVSAKPSFAVSFLASSAAFAAALTVDVLARR